MVVDLNGPSSNRVKWATLLKPCCELVDLESSNIGPKFSTFRFEKGSPGDLSKEAREQSQILGERPSSQYKRLVLQHSTAITLHSKRTQVWMKTQPSTQNCGQIGRPKINYDFLANTRENWNHVSRVILENYLKQQFIKLAEVLRT